MLKGNAVPRLDKTINEEYVKFFGKGFLPPGDSTIKKIDINDLPVLITPDGTIVCIPKLPECAVTGIMGMSGCGKTSLAGYLLDTIYWSWGDYLAIVNDSQDETWDWSEANEYFEFNKKLKMLNQGPMPLPLVYLLPKVYDAREDAILNKNTVTISVPPKDILNNIEKFLPGLGNSEKYLVEKRELLKKAETEEEIFEIIKSIDTGATKGLTEVARKIESMFKELVAEGILNVSDETCPYKLRAEWFEKGVKKEYEGNPFTAIMKLECVPSFITSNLYTQKYKDLVFSYYINSLFRESFNGAMKGKRVWLYFDELTRVVRADPRFSSPETERALNDIVARGRNNGISLIFATQRYREIPKSIRELIKFSVVFRHNSTQEANEIFSDMGVDRTFGKQILTLKKFEAIAFTTEYFVCYKKEKVWKETKPMRGWIMPAQHKNRFLHKAVKNE